MLRFNTMFLRRWRVMVDSWQRQVN